MSLRRRRWRMYGCSQLLCRKVLPPTGNNTEYCHQSKQTLSMQALRQLKRASVQQLWCKSASSYSHRTIRNGDLIREKINVVSQLLRNNGWLTHQRHSKLGTTLSHIFLISQTFSLREKLIFLRLHYYFDDWWLFIILSQKPFLEPIRFNVSKYLLLIIISSYLWTGYLFCKLWSKYLLVVHV